MEKIGIVEEYYPDTQVIRERYETKGGKMHGTCEWFHENGGIKGRTEYVEGVEHGVEEWFHENGEISIRTEYVDDKENKAYEEFYENGESQHRIEFVEDEKHGVEEWFHENGEISIRTEYVEGEQCGPHKEFNPKGDLILDIMLEDGMQVNIKDSLNAVNLDKIIDFLDKLPTEKFDFAEIRSECGSKACVVGWFPNIFPEVEYRGNRFKLNMMDDLSYEKVASYMLNVSEDTALDLFSPRGEINELFPTLPICGDDATPKEVSTMLKAFKEIVMGA